MKPTTILSDEHKNILRMLDILKQECDALDNGKPMDTGTIRKAIFFIRNYADKFHHAKEENILFKEFEKKDAHCNPVPQMLYEHDIGRRYVKEMEEGLLKCDKDKVIENCKGYIELLREHIFKEDNILFPMIDEVIPNEEQKIIERRFKEENDRHDTGECLKILNELSEA